MVDLRCGIKIPRSNELECQPLRPLEDPKVEKNTFERYYRLWEIRREFLKTGFVAPKSSLHLIA